MEWRICRILGGTMFGCDHDRFATRPDDRGVRVTWHEQDNVAVNFDGVARNVAPARPARNQVVRNTVPVRDRIAEQNR